MANIVKLDILNKLIIGKINNTLLQFKGWSLLKMSQY